MTTQDEVSEYRRFRQRAARVCELAEWEHETGRRLPWSAWFVLAVEDRGGRVDLATGAVHLLTAVHEDEIEVLP
jgi:hypothetical protein